MMFTDERTCFICEDSCEGDPGAKRQMPWEGSTLNCQLSVILLVKKILRVPSNILETVLQDKGDPAMWGLKMCGPCRRIFLEAEFLNHRIAQLNKEFSEVSNMLRRQMKSCRLTGTLNETGTSKVEPDKRKRKRRRGQGFGSKGLPLLKGTDDSNISPKPDLRSVLLGSIGEDKVDTPRKVPKDRIKNFVDFSDCGKVEPGTRDVTICDTFTDILPDDEDITMDGEEDAANDDDNDSDYFPPSGGDGDAQTVADSNDNAAIRVTGTDVFALPHQPIKEDDGYLCPICPRKARIKSSMHGHILRAHYNDSNPFHCHLCEKSFKRETLLRTHLERYHDGAATPLDEPGDATQVDGDNDEIEDELELPPLSPPSPAAPNDPGEKLRKYDCDLCPKMKYRVLYKSLETLDAHKKMVHFGIKRPYQCKQCGKGFKLKTVLRQHMYVHRRKVIERKGKNGPFCLECNREFRNFETLREHLQKMGHSSKYPFECELCSEGFMQEAHLEKHKAEQHNPDNNDNKSKVDDKEEPPEEKPFCTECNREFSSLASLKFHYAQSRAHAAQSPYQCELCAKDFMQKSSLRNHQTQEHYKELNISPHKCNFCGKVLSSKRALDHHVRLKHTKDTLFKCEECNLGFMYKILYTRHVSHVHSKEKPLLCTHCPKRFSLKPHLETHMRVHSGEKPYKCKDCGKDFADKPTFNRHIESHGDQVHICAYCSKEFKIWHSFRIHMRAAHKEVIFKYPTTTTTVQEEVKAESSNDASVPASSDVSIPELLSNVKEDGALE